MDFEPLSDSLIAKHERAQRQATLDGVAALLRAKGASDRSLQTVLTGFDEYLTITSALPPPSSPDRPPPTPTQSPFNHPPADLATQDCTLPLSQIPIQPLSWLWPQRIPLGKLTLLDGEPGRGTSLLALTLAACLSRGLPLPGDTAAPTPQGNVLLVAPNDHAGDTIKPRLQAAGADPSHIFLLTTVPTGAATPTATTPERPFCLADDLDLLEATIKRLHATLVIIDPLHTALEPARSRSSSSPASRRQTPRALLSSLARLAQRTGCAFLLVRSVIPKRSDLLHARPTGSPELLSAVPSGLLLTCDPADERTHLLLPTKHTLCQKPVPLAYEIIEHPSGVPVIHWRGPWHGSLSFVLGMSPALSAQRQAILVFLHQSPAPASAGHIVNHIGFDYEPVRKMLQRMAQQGDLVSPARGLYTTPNHPCLTTISPDPETNPPQNPVPSVATQIISPQTDVSPLATDPLSPHIHVPTVATQTTFPRIEVSPLATQTTFPQNPVPNVATETPPLQTDVSIVATVPPPEYSPLPVAPVSISPSTTPDQTDNASP